MPQATGALAPHCADRICQLIVVMFCEEVGQSESTTALFEVTAPHCLRRHARCLEPKLQSTCERGETLEVLAFATCALPINTRIGRGITSRIRNHCLICNCGWRSVRALVSSDTPFSRQDVGDVNEKILCVEIAIISTQSLLHLSLSVVEHPTQSTRWSPIFSLPSSLSLSVDFARSYTLLVTIL